MTEVLVTVYISVNPGNNFCTGHEGGHVTFTHPLGYYTDTTRIGYKQPNNVAGNPLFPHEVGVVEPGVSVTSPVCIQHKFIIQTQKYPMSEIQML